jgi:hypothetical protein
MNSQQLAEQRRLEEILKLARMQLNEEYMKKHSAAHTAWLTGARTAWNSSGVLLPFATKFVYPSEEEVVARGVEIYNTLTPKTATAPVAPAPIIEQTQPVEEIVIEPTVELLQAGGDFVLAEVVEEEVLPMTIEDNTTATEVNDAEEDITDVEIKEETVPAEEPQVKEKPTIIDSLLENKFKSLFTKWGGKGNF